MREVDHTGHGGLFGKDVKYQFSFSFIGSSLLMNSALKKAFKNKTVQ